MAKKKPTKGKKVTSKRKPKVLPKVNLRQYLPLALIIAVLGFLVYANTFQHEWALDDFSVIKENWVTQSGIEGIGTHLTHSYRYGYGTGYNTLYRPLTLVMFTIEWMIAPDNPGFMHFVNVLFYALCGFVIFMTLMKVMRGYNVFLPFVGTLLFMVHPLHVESVANIKGRDDIMGMLFFFLAIYWLWDYLRNADVKWLALSVGSYFLSLLSKESSITFVAIIPLMMFVFTKIEMSKTLKISALYLGAALFFIFLRGMILGSTVGVTNTQALDNVMASADGFMEEKATAFLILGRYFKLLFFPHPLVSDAGAYQIPVTTFGDWRVLLSMVIHVGLGVWALLNISKKSIPAFAILFYILTFSVTSNLFIQIGTGYAERLLFVPLLGFTLGLAWVVMWAFGIDLKDDSKFEMGSFFLKTGSKNTIALGLVGLITLGFSYKTFDRNWAWKDSFTLYDTDVKISPNCAKLQFHYGLEMSKRGLEATGDEQADLMMQTKAIFERAVEIYPAYHDAYQQLGLWHYRAGYKEKALELYQQSIDHKPNNPKAYSNMGIIYFEENNLIKAEEVYLKAVQLDPRYVDALQNLGSVYAMRGRFDQAIEKFQQGLKYASTDEQKENLNRFLQMAIRDKNGGK